MSSKKAIVQDNRTYQNQGKVFNIAHQERKIAILFQYKLKSFKNNNVLKQF